MSTQPEGTPTGIGGAAGAAGAEQPTKPTRAQQRRAEEFERLCATGWTVCCGGGRR
ncbi:MAG TPA: hypothetical protein PLT68_03935 [Actinomycetota bacterium]|nr:hypothetical protein [Actinomycetota bacterium]